MSIGRIIKENQPDNYEKLNGIRNQKKENLSERDLKELMHQCRRLEEYAIFVRYVREYTLSELSGITISNVLLKTLNIRNNY